MTTRYPHYLRAAAAKRNPPALICVDCTSTVEPVTATASHKSERLDSWHAVCLTLKADAYGITRQVSGRDRQQWWSLLAEQVAHLPNAWVVSYRCTRIWSLLGMWEELEDERWTVGGYDNRTGNHGATGAGTGSGGLLVIEDVPNIAMLNPAGSKHGCLWIDARNHGAEVAQDVLSGHDTATWLATYMRQLTSALCTYKLGALQATVGAQAMHGYRRSYLHRGIYVHNDAGALEIERAGYYGGRCECFQIGATGTSATHLDYRSQYASVGVRSQVPIRLVRRVPNPGQEGARAGIAAGNVIATVAIETPENAYPYRRRRDGGVTRGVISTSREAPHVNGDTDTIFPVGRFITTLCGPELQDAMERGRIVRVIGYAQYQMAHALQSYMESIYAMRLHYERTCTTGLASYAKRLLVSLPGKFGQRDRRWTPTPDIASDVAYGEWFGSRADGTPCRYRSVASRTYRDDLLGWSAESVPSIAAWVTSAARVKLLQAIRVAGWGEIFYCDTDSLILSQLGESRLRDAGHIRPGELGELYVKRAGAETVIHGVKHYSEDGAMVCSGLPRGACTDAGDGLHYWHQLTPSWSVRRGLRPEAQRVLKPYQRRQSYRQGQVDTDGKVMPFVLEEF